MIELPSNLRRSARSVAGWLLVYWFASSLLISGAFALFRLWEQRERMMRDGAHAAHVVAASLRTPLTRAQREELLEAYGQPDNVHRIEGMNVLLVVDDSGRIAYSSRSAWRSLNISDSLLDQMAGDDEDFRAVVNCFRSRSSDCMALRSIDWHLHWSGFTVVRPVSMPPMDLGLPKQSFLVLVNFDAGVLVGEVLQSLPGLMLFAALISALLTAGLWLLFTTRLLPELMEDSQVDALTQLSIRTTFMDQAMELLVDAEESKGDLVFAILDLDEFKIINDTYGHSCGDAALASVGSLLLAVTRPQDLVCRFGGEEFALLLPLDRDTASKVLERMRLQLMMNSLVHNGHRIHLSVSIGAAATAQCGYNLDFLYNAADKALYVAKEAGRNRVEWNAGELFSRLPITAAPAPQA
ncbi:MAG: diguanylate cyclase domain-containing protein [Cyanobium sp.]